MSSVTSWAMTAPGADDAGPEPPDAGSDAKSQFGIAASANGQLASFGQRLLARLLDFLVVGLPLSILVYATSDIDPAKGVSTPVWAQVVAAAVSSIYEVALIRLRGQTVGKQVVGISVVRVTDGALPDWTAAIVRYLLPLLPLLVPIPGAFLVSLVVFLAALGHPLRRGWHDRAAGTIVVKAPAVPRGL